MKLFLILFFIFSPIKSIAREFWTNGKSIYFHKPYCKGRCVVYDGSCPLHLCKIEDKKFVRDSIKMKVIQDAIEANESKDRKRREVENRFIPFRKSKEAIEDILHRIYKRTDLSAIQKRKLESKIYPVLSRLNVGLARDALGILNEIETDRLIFRTEDKSKIVSKIQQVIED